MYKSNINKKSGRLKFKKKYRYKNLGIDVFKKNYSTWPYLVFLKKKKDRNSLFLRRRRLNRNFVKLLLLKKKNFLNVYPKSKIRSIFWEEKVLFLKKKKAYLQFNLFLYAFLKKFLIKSRFIFLNFFFKKKNIFLNISKSNGHLLISQSLKTWLSNKDEFKRADVFVRMRFFKIFFTDFKDNMDFFVKNKKLINYSKLRFILSFTGSIAKFTKFIRYLGLPKKINILCVRSRSRHPHNGCRSIKKKRKKRRNKNKFSKKITKIF